MQMGLIKGTQLIIVTYLIGEGLHLALKINLSGLTAFPWERPGLAGPAGAGWQLAFPYGQILPVCF